MKPIPDISRRSVLRALTASAAVAFAVAATGSAAAAAPGQVVATPDAGTQPQGHRHLIGVL
ncbi:hypothetical protein StoSoilA2_10410 [Arthrobacter sp. StoSoilA2]|jgi:hypothetical protein|uniref:hypothetical protein n=1 Tax=Arthrobacter sp. StoSoilA2 TaxID=2830990 RepID=UPI001CC54E73|nr:hypothetical protein [Arthrobacter sp. StoSoilA2]BCW34985.1 hypothetical protein StoSoilA2_10410 [Arthrobacter sp. StoSoilA2]